MNNTVVDTDQWQRPSRYYLNVTFISRNELLESSCRSRHIGDNCCSKMAWKEEWIGKERSARKRGEEGFTAILKGLLGAVESVLWSKRRNRRPETKFNEKKIHHDDNHKVTISLFLKYFLGMEIYSIYSQILKQNSFIRSIEFTCRVHTVSTRYSWDLDVVLLVLGSRISMLRAPLFPY